MERFVDVAIPLPVDGPFTYAVPEELWERVEIGRRVLVPFRNKIRAGFVVGLSGSIADREEVKTVVDVPDEPPYLTGDLWRFLKWIAEYYLLRVGLVLRTALPSGSDRRSKPWAILTPEGRRWFGGKGDGIGLTLPGKLMRSGVMSYRDLAEIIGEGRVREAAERNWIVIE
ncbi:MAG: hypothetical protein FJY85_26240, partial [Deltaproteobacteria bacterium]|nr:hypothetical protein [Deltaproteobacteria bacterium]